MADIAIRKHDDQTASTGSAMETARRPPRFLRRLLEWDPFGEMQPILRSVLGGFTPSFDVKETKDAFVFEADVPGVKESELEVTVSGNRLTIAGKREAKEETRTDTYYACERSYGEFSRSFALPEGADAGNIKAHTENGVLTVIVKKSADLQPKKIAVQSKR